LAPPPVSPGHYLFIAGGADPYWQLCIAGARSAADEFGATLDVLTPADEGEAGLRTQLDWLTAVDDSIDGVAIGPIEPSRSVTLINNVAQSRPVITVDSDVPNSRRLCYIGSSNFEAGTMAANLVKQAVPTGGKVVVLLASRSKTNAAERLEGFEDELATSDESTTAVYEIVDIYLDGGDMQVCAENLRKALDEHQDLSAIFGTFGYHGPLAIEAIAEAGRSQQVQLVCFDEDPRVLDGIATGSVYATIAQDPLMFGRETILMLERLRSGRYASLPVGRRVDVGVHCEVVTRDNLADFRAKLAERQQRLSALED
jgi:ribose transport system substrate-binding protein